MAYKRDNYGYTAVHFRTQAVDELTAYAKRLGIKKHALFDAMAEYILEKIKKKNIGIVIENDKIKFRG